MVHCSLKRRIQDWLFVIKLLILLEKEKNEKRIKSFLSVFYIFEKQLPIFSY